MFGMNSIVGKNYFNKSAEAKEGKLLVTSMFMTLQGEGPYRGEPAFFIRLAKCNLACSFCDTYFDSGEWLSIEEIAERVDESIIKFFSKGKTKVRGVVPSQEPGYVYNEYSTALDDFPYVGFEADNDERHVPEWAGVQQWDDQTALDKRRMVLVITGGEPTIQANLKLLLDWGADFFVKTQIESNGIAVSHDTVPDSTTVVVSPKCREELQWVDHYTPNVIFDRWDFRIVWGQKVESRQEMVPVIYMKPNKKMLERADCLKFVMEANPHSPYGRIPDWAHIWAQETGKPVFISPMNIYLQEPQKAKELRAAKTNTTMEERSTIEEVISGWTPGLLDQTINQANHEYAAKYAIQHGFIFGMQIHLWASVA